MTTLDTLMSHVAIDDKSGCWLWTGSISNRGYGQIGDRGLTRSAHRVSYELLVGSIAPGLTLDHLCRQRRCVNPAHLDQVTNAENIRRANELRTQCRRGHQLQQRTRNGGVSRFCPVCERLALQGVRDDDPLLFEMGQR